MTVVFADLVGSTALAERSDPEDVRAMLGAHHARVRAELERFGGTVEKFIGDAVVAVFGAPVAHEDDPERAVRAALAIRDGATARRASRCASPSTPARHSSRSMPARPRARAWWPATSSTRRRASSRRRRSNGVLVGESTYRATVHVIEYAPAEPVEAKGKSEPVSVWEAVAPRSRFGSDVEQAPLAALVGREREIDVLRGALTRVRQERVPELVTLVGVPGIGKSRIVAELFSIVDADPDIILWRQGRCLPYGEGISYWALGEMAKSQAGILETDGAAEAERKLTEAVAALVPVQTEADWVTTHLRPLVGLGSELGAGGDSRGETFAAWRRFFESLGEQRPTVLVFEDLHWADDGLLDFVDGLVDRATGVPLLVLCSARPELLVRRPGWGGGKANAVTLSLSALSDEDTARLIAEHLAQAVLPAEMQQTLLRRADGNPLFAEEYIRMLRDRGLLRREGGSWRLDADGRRRARRPCRGSSPPGSTPSSRTRRRCCRPRPSSGRSSGSARSPRSRASPPGRPRSGCTRSSARSSSAATAVPRWRGRRSTRCATCSCATSPTARSRAYAAPTCTCARREWIESLGARPVGGSRRDAGPPLPRGAGADPGGGRRHRRHSRRRHALALREAGSRAYALSALESAASLYARALELWPKDDPDYPRLLLELGETLSWARNEGGAGAARRRPTCCSPQARSRTRQRRSRRLAQRATGCSGAQQVARQHYDRVDRAHRRSSRDTGDGADSARGAWRAAGCSRTSTRSLEEGQRILALTEELGTTEEHPQRADQSRDRLRRTAGTRRRRFATYELALDQCPAGELAPRGTRPYLNLASVLGTVGDLEPLGRAASRRARAGAPLRKPPRAVARRRVRGRRLHLPVPGTRRSRVRRRSSSSGGAAQYMEVGARYVLAARAAARGDRAATRTSTPGSCLPARARSAIRRRSGEHSANAPGSRSRPVTSRAAEASGRRARGRSRRPPSRSRVELAAARRLRRRGGARPRRRARRTPRQGRRTTSPWVDACRQICDGRLTEAGDTLHEHDAHTLRGDGAATRGRADGARDARAPRGDRVLRERRRDRVPRARRALLLRNVG